MKYKVGDKVKVIYNSNRSSIVAKAMNKIGVVKSTYSTMVCVKFNENILTNISVISFYENEIEKVVTITKGQQLLFEFML